MFCYIRIELESEEDATNEDEMFGEVPSEQVCDQDGGCTDKNNVPWYNNLLTSTNEKYEKKRTLIM